MSTVKINSEKQLDIFLKILAEESVAAAHKRDRSKDPAQEIYSGKRQKEDIRKFTVENDEDDSESPEDDSSESGQPGSDAAAGSPESDPEESEVDAPASRSSVIDDINDLRAGFSTKKDQVKKNLDAYLERLDDVEIKILDKFLQSLSDILNLRVSGADAADPSDVLDIQYVEKEAQPEEQPEPGPDQDLGGSGLGLPQFEPEEEPEEEGSEDTAPPIRAGSMQETATLRRKIRGLMSL